MDTPDDSDRERPWVRSLVFSAIGLGVFAAVVLLLMHFLATPPGKPRGVQQIALINQPPPPPPKPPEKPPEPPKIKEEVKVETPQEQNKPEPAKAADDKPAADKPLGVDADGASGNDGFGLAANRGGRDLLSGGGGGGAYYSGLLQRQFFEALARNPQMLRNEFRVVVRIWLADDGRIQKADIVSGSGKPDIDTLIQTTLLEMNPLRDVPPASMRPIQLRLSNRA